MLASCVWKPNLETSVVCLCFNLMLYCCCCCCCFSSLNSKLRSSGEHIFSLELQRQREVTGPEQVRGVNPPEDGREDSLNRVRVRWRQAILMEREVERERKLLDGTETIQEFRFYFSVSSLQNKVLTVDGVKVKLQVRRFTFFQGSERLLLQEVPVFPSWKKLLPGILETEGGRIQWKCTLTSFTSLKLATETIQICTMN